MSLIKFSLPSNHPTERKAKEAELKMRDIARKAREEHRKSLNCEQLDVKEEPPTTRTPVFEKRSSPPQSLSPPTSLEGGIARPPNPEAVLCWYRETEMPKGAGRQNNSPSGGPARWFHGLLGRADAEALLANRTQGSFLVRLSEKIWGYAISYKEEEERQFRRRRARADRGAGEGNGGKGAPSDGGNG